MIGRAPYLCRQGRTAHHGVDGRPVRRGHPARGARRQPL